MLQSALLDVAMQQAEEEHTRLKEEQRVRFASRAVETRTAQQLPLQTCRQTAVRKQRSRANRLHKGVDAFRIALIKHMAEKAHIAPAHNGEEELSVLQVSTCGSAASSSLPSVSVVTRSSWLLSYSSYLSTLSLKSLVLESIKYHFPCDPYVILVPNWHALREALWLHLKSISVKRAKRSVSTKKDLIDICISKEVQFDFSNFVKDAESHGNKKERGAAEGGQQDDSSMTGATATASGSKHCKGGSKQGTSRCKKRQRTDQPDEDAEEWGGAEGGEEDEDSSDEEEGEHAHKSHIASMAAAALHSNHMGAQQQQQQ